jgi:hypothetical protein
MYLHSRWFSQCLILCVLLVQVPAVNALERVMDGFFAYCTSNLDATGDCVNQEDGRSMDCIIVPGQIIECQSPQAVTFECVWISSVTANQAQFWCDPSAEAALYGAVNSREFTPRFNKQFSPQPPAGMGVPGAGSNVFEQEF